MGASHFGLMLRQLRKERGATLSEVAEATGISVPMLSRMERGERLPSSDTLKSISAYYGTSARSLAEAAGQQHSLNRYPDSWGPEPETDHLSSIALNELTTPQAPAAMARPSVRREAAVFRAQPISALFEPEVEEPSGAVEDATLAAEAAVRQLGRELRRSASAMSEEERDRIREEIRRLGDALNAYGDASWWDAP